MDKSQIRRWSCGNQWSIHTLRVDLDNNVVRMWRKGRPRRGWWRKPPTVHRVRRRGRRRVGPIGRERWFGAIWQKQRCHRDNSAKLSAELLVELRVHRDWSWLHRSQWSRSDFGQYEPVNADPEAYFCGHTGHCWGRQAPACAAWCCPPGWRRSIRSSSRTKTSPDSLWEGSCLQTYYSCVMLS